MDLAFLRASGNTTPEFISVMALVKTDTCLSQQHKIEVDIVLPLIVKFLASPEIFKITIVILCGA